MEISDSYNKVYNKTTNVLDQNIESIMTEKMDDRKPNNCFRPK